jgi:uncharacterized membrane protein YkvA (DUF1232 family)
MFAQLRRKTENLKGEVTALYLAMRDPRTPWYAKALAACVVGYAFSPIDLIPDYIPVVGQLDDLVLVPLGILGVRSMIPASVMVECREKAAKLREKPRSPVVAVLIIATWLFLAGLSILWLGQIFKR